MTFVNDNNKPLILLGSNHALWFIKDICERQKITIHGLIDSDYYGNTESLEDIKIIDTELSFNDPVKLKYYKENFNFFLVVNWTGQQSPIFVRNFEKRLRFIDIIKKYDLNCISLIDQTSMVHGSNIIGRNVLVDGFCYISAYNEIGDFTTIFAYTILGNHNKISENCVLQRRSGLHNSILLEENVYVGLCSIIFQDIVLKKGTIVHPCLAVNRSTKENEIISLAGRDLRRIYPNIQEI